MSRTIGLASLWVSLTVTVLANPAAAGPSPTIGLGVPRIVVAPTGRPDLRVSPILLKNLEQAFLDRVTQEFVQRCQARAVGCAIAGRGGFGTTSERAAGSARRAPDSAPRAMSATDPITMASVSKVFTGTAMVRLLADKGIGLDSAIGPYLPPDWVVNDSIQKITFRQLLTHKSGLACAGIDNQTLKLCFQVSEAVGQPIYRNENYAIMRILINEVRGVTHAMRAYVKANPGYFDTAYASGYGDYLQPIVFTPAGVLGAKCKTGAFNPALSYKSATAHKYNFSSVLSGENWGDMTNVCGSQGWNFSAREMAKIMQAIYTPGTVLTKSTLDEVKAGGLANFYIANVAPGINGWSHGGYHPAEWNGGEINTFIIHLSNNTSFGIIINSPYRGADVDTGGDYYTDFAAAVNAARQ